MKRESEDGEGRNEKGSSRRGFLRAGAGCVAGCAGLSLLNLAGCGSGSAQAGDSAPASNVALADAREGPAGTFTLAGAATLAKDKSLVFQDSAQRPVVVFVGAGGEIQALSAKCTHTGCTVEWQSSGKERFRCPCHNSVFDETGKVLGGPAPRPLPAFKATKQGADVVVVVS